MIRVVAFELGGELEMIAVVHLAVVPHETAAGAGAVFLSDAASHEPKVGSEVGSEPAVVPRCLPVARAPRVVAQTTAGNVEFLIAHADGAMRFDELLVVTLCEFFAGCLVWLIGLAAKH